MKLNLHGAGGACVVKALRICSHNICDIVVALDSLELTLLSLANVMPCATTSRHVARPASPTISMLPNDECGWYWPCTDAILTHPAR